MLSLYRLLLTMLRLSHDSTPKRLFMSMDSIRFLSDRMYGAKRSALQLSMYLPLSISGLHFYYQLFSDSFFNHYLFYIDLDNGSRCNQLLFSVLHRSLTIYGILFLSSLSRYSILLITCPLTCLFLLLPSHANLPLIQRYSPFATFCL